MKIFEKDEKINFVDENNVFVGYDLSQHCCEDASYLFYDAELKTELFDEYDFSGFLFDMDFTPDYNLFESVLDFNLEDGDFEVFKLVKEKKEIYLILYNCHNGYYSHGFEYGKDGKKKGYGCL